MTNKKTVIESDELVPGMAAQGKGVKCYVESDYAPLKACIVGNPSSIIIPDPDTWEMGNMFAHSGKEFNAYLRKHKGKHMKDVDPKRYDKIVHESDSLAEAYRKAGVKVIRNETGKTHEGIVNSTFSWSRQKHLSLYGQSALEVFGHCLVQFHEVTASQTEFAHREALVEIMKNDHEAIWLSMPPLFPSADQRLPGPTLSPGDPIIFPKTVVLGIGVSDASHVTDTSKPRSSGDEFGNEILRRMLAPFGWKVETIYFDSRLSYHLDCVVTPLEEGLIAMPKNAFWTPPPARFRDWEVIDVSVEDVKLGAMNNEVIGGKRIVLPAGTKFARDLEKRGWTCIEVPYKTCYETFGSGIHCSTASIWRES
jgi:N-dimethylarginine dimethylaminohydrolase